MLRLCHSDYKVLFGFRGSAAKWSATAAAQMKPNGQNIEAGSTDGLDSALPPVLSI